MPPPDRLFHLRTICSLLTSTQESELPAHAPQLASLLYSSPILDSAIALAADQPHRARAEEASVLVNKFKARVSSLLQSRNAQARWCGVVLVKCSVESSFEALAAWGAVWTRLMVPLVTRPEPSSTHFMVVRTLTRISTTLTADKPSLTREIVTPNLPAVFMGLLGLAVTYTEDLDTGILATVLEAIRDLVTAHPVTFRPFVQKAKAAVLHLLKRNLEREVERLCCEIYVSLHLCASGSGKRVSGQLVDSNCGKQNAVATEWNSSISNIIAATHNTLDGDFAPIEEDQSYRQSFKNGTSAEEPDLGGANELLRLLEAFFTCPAPAQSSIPVPRLLELTSRILAVTASSQHNPAIETKHREALFCKLPSLHRAALDLLNSIAKRLQKHFVPLIPWILEQISDIFADERWSSDLRTSCYNLATTLFSLAGPSLSKSIADSLHTLISSLCDDLVPHSEPTSTPVLSSTKKLKASQKPATGSHADTLLATTKPFKFISTPTIAAATSLLTASLSYIPGSHVRSELRAKMERTAVLTGNTEAMMAAVLFPRPAATVTLVPHLVGQKNTGLAVEGIVRPRLPVIWTGPTRTERKAAEEAEEADGVDEDGHNETAHDGEYGRDAKRMRFDETLSVGPDVARPPPPALLRDAPELHPPPSDIPLSPEKQGPPQPLPATAPTNLTPVVAIQTVPQSLGVLPVKAVVPITTVVEAVKTHRTESRPIRNVDDDDLDMEGGIPEIVLGDSSSEDEDNDDES